MRKVLILAAAVFCVATAGVAGIFASGGDDVVHTVKSSATPDKSLLSAEEPAKPEILKPMGDPSPKVEESTFALTNQTPLALLEGILSARERGDQAWLARTLESTAGHAEITQDDCAAGWRNYLWAPEMWDRFGEVHRKNPADISVDGDEARLTFDVGGNAGIMFVLLKRINGAWYLAGA